MRRIKLLSLTINLDKKKLLIEEKLQKLYFFIKKYELNYYKLLQIKSLELKILIDLCNLYIKGKIV